MIPDHLIEKAMDAYVENSPGARCLRTNMEDALEAVAADIWAQGFDAGERDVWEHERGSYDDPCIPNPYRASETA